MPMFQILIPTLVPSGRPRKGDAPSLMHQSQYFEMRWYEGPCVEVPTPQEALSIARKMGVVTPAVADIDAREYA